MTETEAKNLYFKHSGHALRKVKHLMLWDTSKSIRENSVKIGKAVGYCTELSKSYNLKYRKVGKGYGRREGMDLCMG